MDFDSLSPEQQDAVLKEMRGTIQRGAKAIYRAVSDGRLEPGEDTAALFEMVDQIVPGTLSELRQEMTTARTKERPDGSAEARREARRSANRSMARRTTRGMGLATDRASFLEETLAVAQQLPGVRNITAGAESALVGGAQVAATLGEIIGGDFAGESGESAKYAEYRKALAQELAKDDPANPAIATLSRGARSASESIAMAVPLGAAGGFPAVISGFTLSSGSEAMDEGRSAGLRGRKLAAYASTAAGIEAIVTTAFQALGRGGFESYLSKDGKKQLSAQAMKQMGTVHGAIRGLFKRIGEEQAEELAIYGLQEANRWAHGVMQEGKKPEDFAQEIIDVMVATTIGTGAMGARSVVDAAQNQAERGRRLEDRQQQRAEFNEQRRTDRLTDEPMRRANQEGVELSEAIAEESREGEAALTKEQQARAMSEGRELVRAQNVEQNRKTSYATNIPNKVQEWLDSSENRTILAEFEGPLTRSQFKAITGVDKTNAEQRQAALDFAKSYVATPEATPATTESTTDDLFSQPEGGDTNEQMRNVDQEGRSQAPVDATPATPPAQPPDARQVPAAPTIQSPIIRQQGRTHKLVVTGQPTRRAVYAVVRLSDLAPSHNEDRGFSPNERHPGNVRDYSTNTQMQAEVEAHARRLDPDRLLDPTASNALGPPLVDKNGVVIGGNSRTMKMARAARLYPQRFAEYQQRLREEADAFGIDPSQVTDDAVLVRMVDLPDPETKQLIRTLNDPESRSDSESELAFKIGKAIPPEVSQDFRINDDKTLRENLRQRGVGFFRKLVAEGVIPSNQESQYISEEGDRPALTSMALDTLENSMVARLVGDKAVYDAMTPREREIVLRSAPVILNFHNEVANGRIDAAADMLPHVPGAIRLARTGGKSIGQADAFDSGTPEETTLARAYQYAWSNPGKTRQLFSQIAEALDSYTLSSAGEVDMFGGKPEINMAGIIGDAINIRLAKDAQEAMAKNKVEGLELPEMGDAQPGLFASAWDPQMELDFGFAPTPERDTEPPRPTPRIFQLSDMVELVRSQGVIAAIKKRYANAGTLGMFYPWGRGIVSVRFDIFAGPVVMQGQASNKAFPVVREETIRKSVANFLLLHGADPKQVEKYTSFILDDENQIEKPFLMRDMPDGFSAQIVPRTRKGESDVYIMKGLDEVARLVVTEGKGSKPGKRAIVVQRHMPDYANKIVAHEIGHMVDYLPEKTMKRGNILGRIASLQKYMQPVMQGIIGTNKEIRDELIALTKWWSGDFDPKTKFGKYRQSSVELYAEAWSVLLNNPTRLQQMAPKFYDALMGNMRKKPDIADEYNRINTEIANGTSEARSWQRLKEGRQRGEELLKQIAEGKKDKTKATATRGEILAEVLMDVQYATKARTREVIGGLSNEVEDAIDTAVYSGAIAEGYLNHLRRQVTDYLADAGISIDTFNEYLTALRVMTERQDMANPAGATAESARARVAEMKTQLGPDGMRAIEEARQNFRRVRMDVIRRMEASQAFDPETMQQIRENEYYTRFQVLQPLVEELSGETGRQMGLGQAALTLQRQFGTFQDIAPPLQVTAMQDVALIRLMARNTAKRVMVDSWKRNLPDQIQEASFVNTDKGKQFVEPKHADWGLITFKRNGKLEGYYVPAIVARGFNEQPTQSSMFIAQSLNSVANFSRALFTYRNPGFAPVNMTRDAFRLFNNLPTQAKTGRLRKAARILTEMATAQPEAWRREFGETPTEAVWRAFQNVFFGANIPAPKPRIGKTIGQLLDDGLLIASYTDTRIAQQDLSMEGEIERINEMASAPTAQKALTRILKSAWEFPVKLNGAAEAATKVAAYNYLQKYFPEMSKAERNYLVRHAAGSPSFITRGRWTGITNSVFLFSNAFLQANRSNIRVAVNNPADVATNYGASVMGPKALSIAISSGAATIMAYAMFGVSKDTPEEEKPYPVRWLEDLESAYKKIGMYDMSNYLVMPLGVQSDGRVVYARVPMDESQRLVAHALQSAVDVAMNKKDPSVLFALGFDQIPGLNPIIEAAMHWQDFVRGRNPYDAYRQRNIIDRDVFESDRTRAAIDLAKETWNSLGGGILYRFNTTDPAEHMSTLEKIVTGPVISNVLGRWIKVSNQGDMDLYNRTAELQRREEAAERTVIRDIVSKRNQGVMLDEQEEALLQANPERAQRAQERIEVREGRDPLSRALLNTNSVAQRDAITLEAAKKDPSLNIAEYDPRRARSMAQAITKPMPAKMKDQEAWRAERQEAIEWFQARNVTFEQAMTAFQPELDKLSDQRTKARKRLMLRNALTRE